MKNNRRKKMELHFEKVGSQRSKFEETATGTITGRLYARKLSAQEKMSLLWLSESVQALMITGSIWYDPVKRCKVPKTDDREQVINIPFINVPEKYKEKVMCFLRECDVQIFEMSPREMNVQTKLKNAMWLANIRKLIR